MYLYPSTLLRTCDGINFWRLLPAPRGTSPGRWWRRAACCSHARAHATGGQGRWATLHGTSLSCSPSPRKRVCAHDMTHLSIQFSTGCRHHHTPHTTHHRSFVSKIAAAVKACLLSTGGLVFATNLIESLLSISRI